MGIKCQVEMTLVMWSKEEMNDRAKNKQTGEWEDTGKKIEKTKYYLRDEFGDKLEFLADNEYRDLEGSQVMVTLDISYNDYQNKNVVKLDSLIQLPS